MQKKIYLLTKYLVIASLLLSVVSIYSTKAGWGEIYPFYFWKLYSQPLGNTKVVSEYRIYAKQKSDSAFCRMAVKDNYTFTVGEYVYTLHRLVTDYSNTRSETNKNRLYDFVKHVEPEYEQYEIIKETYRPLEIFKNENVYDTSVEIIF